MAALTSDMRARIDNMSREELCRAWRFEPIGSTFWNGESGDYAKARLDALGGFSPEISKRIGRGHDEL